MKALHRISLWVILLALATGIPGFAQTINQFSLKQSIDYALQNQERLKVARNETEIARAKVGEIRSIGLPQLNFGADLGYNFIQQKTLVDFSAFGSPQQLNNFTITQQQINSGQDITLTPQYTTPEPTGPALQAISFVQPWTGSAAISASQLLFDGSYLIGLKAASTYTQLATKNLKQTEIDVAEQVSKAYYSVLVSRERKALLDENIRRVDTLLKQTKVMNQNGFVEKLDVDRLQVTYNNLKVEKQKTERLLELGEDLLKFQMGMNQTETLELTDKLAEVEIDLTKLNSTGFNYSNRIEYSLMETNRDLALLDIKNIRAGYYPKLLLNARYGYNGVGSSLSDVLDVRGGANNTTDRNYFDFGFVGIGLQIPIFDGLRKHYQGQQAKLRLDNARSGLKILEQSIDLQLSQANTTVQNSLQVLEAQKQNMDLAENIARVAKIKYQEGVGSNLEVITAETELRQAQTNYYGALYDALIAKVDLDKSTGTLLNR